MDRSPLAPLALLLGLAVSACGGPADAPADAPVGGDVPHLGVLVVVDQLRADLLTRYDDLFSGGFRRLLDQGAVFTNATHDHGQTSTAPGHTTIGTGRFPRHHGVPGNSWYEEVDGTWRSVYAVADTTVEILADPGLPGRSPANIRTDGIGDWVREADPEARVIGISRKDRGAIPLTGHAAQDAYWLALGDGVGGFTTSTYYHDALPAWVRAANEVIGPTLWGDTVWAWGGEEAWRPRARPDADPHEADGVHTTLPHHSFVEVDMMDRSAWGEWLADSPAPDAAVTTLAVHALRELELGRRGSVDLLALSYSSVDGVGHTFGPLSLEQLDNLLHLDRELAILMDSLDARVGVGNWTLALSADHGVADFPEYRVSQGLPGRRVSEADLVAADAALEGVATGDGGFAAAAVLNGLDVVAQAYPFARLQEGNPADSLEALYVNGYVEGRVVDFPGLEVAVRMPEGFIDDEFGSTHGSPYHYDRWVPFIVLGPGVEAGAYPERAATADIAPTLATLLGIPVPVDVDGVARLR